MQAAVLESFGVPSYAEFRSPVARDGAAVAQVLSAAVSRFDIAFSAGRHYLRPAQFPIVAGREGIGALADGRRIYFDKIVAPYGAMAELTLVDPSEALDVPSGVDDAVAAALGNAGLAGWMPLEWRARLRVGETVLVLGAGICGRLAIQSAKLLGAKRVIAAGRDAKSLAEAQTLGADAVVSLEEGCDVVEAIREAAAGQIDVVLDYVGGAPAKAALQAIGPRGRFVHIGTMAGDTLELSGAVARKQAVELYGFAIYHAPLAVRTASYQRLCTLARDGSLSVDVERMPLAEVSLAFERQARGERKRIVLIP